MHHLRFWALYSRRVRERTRLSPLYRVSSLAPQPDPNVPQARCSLRVPQRLMVRPAFTLTPLILGFHFIPSAPRCSRYARGYRCCEPWAHSCLSRHSALPCLRFTARRHRHITISPQGLPRYCRTYNSGSDEHGRNRYCVSDFAHARQLHYRTSAKSPCTFRKIEKENFGLAP